MRAFALIDIYVELELRMCDFYYKDRIFEKLLYLYISLHKYCETHVVQMSGPVISTTNT